MAENEPIGGMGYRELDKLERKIEDINKDWKELNAKINERIPFNILAWSFGIFVTIFTIIIGLLGSGIYYSITQTNQAWEKINGINTKLAVLESQVPTKDQLIQMNDQLRTINRDKK